MTKCTIIRSRQTFHGRQGLDYRTGVSTQTAGALALCLHRLTMPPGARATPHLHEDHESAIYMISGRTVLWWGQNLEHQELVGPGDFVHIPAGVPHLPLNPGPTAAEAVVARTDPDEQESVVLLPALDALAV